MAHTSYKESYKESESATRHWRTRSSTEPDNRHSSFLQRWQESRMGPARILLVGIVIVVLSFSGYSGTNIFPAAYGKSVVAGRECTTGKRNKT